MDEILLKEEQSEKAFSSETKIKTVSSRSEEQQGINKTYDNKNPEMDKCKQRDTDDQDEENDHKPTAKEEKQAHKAQNFSDMDND